MNTIWNIVKKGVILSLGIKVIVLILFLFSTLQGVTKYSSLETKETITNMRTIHSEVEIKNDLFVTTQIVTINGKSYLGIGRSRNISMSSSKSHLNSIRNYTMKLSLTDKEVKKYTNPNLLQKITKLFK